MSNYYQIYGVSLQSEISLPELETNRIATPLNDVINIKLRKTKPQNIKNPWVKGLYFQGSEKEWWHYIPPIGHFKICKGKSISIYPKKNIDEDSLREVLLTTALQTALIQRGSWVIPGAAIKLQNECFIIMGASGAGKSTLAAALWKKGYSVLSDDFVVVNNKGEVFSGYPYLKLWLGALQALEIDMKSLKKIRPQLHKYFLPLNGHYHKEPLPIKAIYFIQDNNSDDYAYERITGVKKIQVLQNWLQGKFRKPEIEKHHLANVINVAQQVPMELIVRPHQDYKLNECIEHIEENMKET